MAVKSLAMKSADIHSGDDDVEIVLVNDVNLDALRIFYKDKSYWKWSGIPLLGLATYFITPKSQGKCHPSFQEGCCMLSFYLHGPHNSSLRSPELPQPSIHMACL